MKKLLYLLLSKPAVILYMLWIDVNLYFFIHGRKIKLTILHTLHIAMWIVIFYLIFSEASKPITGSF